MRSLRSSLATSSLGVSSKTSPSSVVSRRGVKQTESVTAYTAVPSKRLNLVDSQVFYYLIDVSCIQVNYCCKFGGGKSIEKAIKERYKKYCENSKERKKRIWQEKKEKWRNDKREGKDKFDGWMFLPDLILEHIFKFLSYKVRSNPC